MKISITTNQKGQAVVEYIMLIVVLSAIVTAIFNSPPFKNIFGTNTVFFNKMKAQIEYSYRHGRPGEEDSTNIETGNHETYVENSTTTRFFAPLNPYQI